MTTYTDTFTRADRYGLGEIPDGPPWQMLRGLWYIRSGVALCTSDRNDNPLAVAEFGSANFDITGDCHAGDALVARVVDAGNWLRALVETQADGLFRVRIERCQSGSRTVLAFSPWFASWAGRLRFRGEDSTLSAYRWDASSFGLSHWVLVKSVNVQGHPQVGTHGIGRGPTYSQVNDAIDNFSIDTLKVTPYAPINLAPSSGSISLETSQVFSWTPSNAGGSNTQSAYNFRRRQPESSSSWVETGWVATTQPRVTVPAGTFGQGTVEWQVATISPTGIEGPWSASAFTFAARTPGAATIVSPASGTVALDPFTDVTWSTPFQAGYRVQVVDAGTSAVVFSSGEVFGLAGETRRTLRVPLPTSGVDYDVQVAYFYNGLWAPWATSRVTTGFGSPATPGLVVVEAAPNPAAITVSVDHGTPQGSQPVASVGRAWARSVGETGDGKPLPYSVSGGEPLTDGHLSAAFVDWTPEFGTPREYRVASVSSDGAVTYSPWSTVSVPAPDPEIVPVEVPAAPALELFVSTTRIDGWVEAVQDATAYDVQWRQVGASSWTDELVDATSRSIEITGLSPSTAYEVRARTQNSAGESAWTTETVSTSATTTEPTPSQLLTEAETNPSGGTGAWRGIRATVGRTSDPAHVTTGTHAWTLTPDGTGAAQMTRSDTDPIVLADDATEITFVARDAKSLGATRRVDIGIDWFTGALGSQVFHSRTYAAGVEVGGSVTTLTYAAARPDWNVTLFQPVIYMPTTPDVATAPTPSDVLVVNELDLDVTATGERPVEPTPEPDTGVPGVGSVLWRPDLAAGSLSAVFEYEVVTGSGNSSFPVVAGSTDPSGRVYRVNVPSGSEVGTKHRTRFRDIGLAESSERYFSVELKLPSSMDLTSSTAKFAWGLAGLPDSQSGWYTSAGGSKKADSWSVRWTHLTPNYLAWKYGSHPLALNAYLYAHHAGGQTLSEYGIEIPFRTGLNGASGTWYDLSDHLDERIPLTGYVKMNTPGVNDGVFRAWIGTTLWVEVTDVRWNASGTPRINQVINETFFNSAISPGGAIEYSNMRISDVA